MYHRSWNRWVFVLIFPIVPQNDPTDISDFCGEGTPASEPHRKKLGKLTESGLISFAIRYFSRRQSEATSVSYLVASENSHKKLVLAHISPQQLHIINNSAEETIQDKGMRWELSCCAYATDI